MKETLSRSASKSYLTRTHKKIKPKNKNSKPAKTKEIKKKNEILDIEIIKAEQDIIDNEGFYNPGTVLIIKDEIPNEDIKLFDLFLKNKLPNQGSSLLTNQYESIKQIEEEDKASEKIEPEIIQALEESGKILETYTSGKLPKFIIMMPQTQKWVQYLKYTHPDKWTPHAMKEIVNIMINGLEVHSSEIFLREVI